MMPAHAVPRCLCFALAVLLLASRAAPSPDEDFCDRGISAFATAGRVHVGDEGSLGGGASYGGAVQLAVLADEFGWAGLELGIDRFEHQIRRENSVVSGSGRLVSLAATYHLFVSDRERSAVDVLIGGGILRSDRDRSGPAGGDTMRSAEPAALRSRTKHGVFLAGIGYDFRFSRPFSLRPMLRYVGSNGIGRYEASVGFGFHLTSSPSRPAGR